MAQRCSLQKVCAQQNTLEALCVVVSASPVGLNFFFTWIYKCFAFFPALSFSFSSATALSSTTWIYVNTLDKKVERLCCFFEFLIYLLAEFLILLLPVCVPSNRKKQYEEFSQKVKEAYEDSKKQYGAVKICRTLNGIPCSIKRVQRHMAKQGLRSVVVKKYNHHANHGTVPDDKENILKRDFETETINQKWCTDITYIHVQKEGWTYLASLMDLCSRKIIGYAYGTSMTAELAIKAVKNACLNVRETRGIILHNDTSAKGE